MREIKFRAYINDQMFYFGLQQAHRYNWDDRKLMQFTGLKDKNGKGKEVYEGDLIQNHPSIDPLLVEFKNGSFGCMTKSGIWMDLRGLLGNHEIIGNVYEDGGLLK